MSTGANSVFKVRVTTETPICLGQTYWTLDAILYGIIKDARLKAEQPGSALNDAEIRADIPITSTNGVFHTSAANFKDMVTSEYTKIGGIRPVTDASRPEIFTSKRDRLSRIGTTRGRLKAHLTRYTLITCKEVFWLAEGNSEMVLAILRTVPAIGAKVSDGFGVISSLNVAPHNAPWTFTDRALPVRPIPTSLLPDFTTNGEIAVDTWLPPYWDQNAASACFLPKRQF